MNRDLILSTLKNCIKSEISNDFIINDDNIIISFPNGRMAKITLKTV